MKRHRLSNNGPQTEVAKNRYRLYKYAYERIDLAFKAGFYLEAITLEESIISDRLEALLFWITQSNEFDFSNLGNLVKKVKKNCKENEFLNLCEEIDDWRQRRNKMMHEFVKLDSAKEPENIYVEAKNVVKEGKILARKVSAKVRKLNTELRKAKQNVGS